jgi:DNA-binding CsgD family transcriptional regulator
MGGDQGVAGARAVSTFAGTPRREDDAKSPATVTTSNLSGRRAPQRPRGRQPGLGKDGESFSPTRAFLPLEIDAERRGRPSTHDCRVVAFVDLQPVVEWATGDVEPSAVRSVALQRLLRCLRPTDSICVVGPTRLAICMGDGGQHVAPITLGMRLAKAVGGHLAVKGARLKLNLCVGISTCDGDVPLRVLATAAMASLEASRSHARTNGKLADTSPPFLAVTTIGGNSAKGRISRRVLFPILDDDGVRGHNGHEAHAPAAAEDTRLGISPSRKLRVLLVDPEADDSSDNNAALEVVAGITRRLGAMPIVCRSRDAESLRLNIGVMEPDLAVIVLQVEGGRSSQRQRYAVAWDGPAALTRALREVKVPVIALRMGASAAALAACAEQGAIGIMHPDRLAHEVVRMANGSSRSNGSEYPLEPGRLPEPFSALVHLTPSERRVLFHMMEGRTAVSIAAAQVISVTTVRSHIRSILRKLNVNSQLAAVALAFGTILDRIPAE